MSNWLRYGFLLIVLAPSLALAQRYHQSPEAIAERLLPVGQVTVTQSAKVQTEPVEIKPLTAAAIYDKHCVICHDAGVAGAPKKADAVMWKLRLAKGFTAIWKNSLVGLNAMPAKGGCMDCSDEDIKRAIIYMLPETLKAQAQKKS